MKQQTLQQILKPTKLDKIQNIVIISALSLFALYKTLDITYSRGYESGLREERTRCESVYKSSRDYQQRIKEAQEAQQRCKEARSKFNLEDFQKSGINHYPF